jgi:hypothetical protein
MSCSAYPSDSETGSASEREPYPEADPETAPVPETDSRIIAG